NVRWTLRKFSGIQGPQIARRSERSVNSLQRAEIRSGSANNQRKRMLQTDPGGVSYQTSTRTGIPQGLT
ncbi:MAG: hypothetical protein ACO3FE_13930, partial [Planctomycetaceae bacterium]